eukprot:scaffold80357_cov63-Phaeocystis_antarctica.AAC.4
MSFERSSAHVKLSGGSRTKDHERAQPAAYHPHLHSSPSSFRLARASYTAALAAALAGMLSR